MAELENGTRWFDSLEAVKDYISHKDDDKYGTPIPEWYTPSQAWKDFKEEVAKLGES